MWRLSPQGGHPHMEGGLLMEGHFHRVSVLVLESGSGLTVWNPAEARSWALS